MPDATRGMAEVNVLHVAAVASTAASAAALQWWAASLLDEARAAGDGGDWLAAVLRSRVTVALLANLVAHVFLLLILALKTLFFVRLTSLETRKVLEQIINYLIYKGSPGAAVKLLGVQVLETASCRNAGKGCVHKTQSGWTLPRTLRKQELRAPDCPFLYSFIYLSVLCSSITCLLGLQWLCVVLQGTLLPLVVPPSSQQMILWSIWLVILCSLKMFQSLAKERLEQLNASPSATPSKYFRVYSAFLLVLSTDILWMRLCVGFGSSCNSKLFWLLFFEPLGIAFETLQSIMVHGFQLFDIWQRHLMDSGSDFLDFQKSYKQVAGSFSELRGKLIRNFGFAIDLISLSMSVGHYSMIFWLRGMAFHLVDTVLLLNLRALIVSFLKRIKTYIKLRKALSSLDGALPDATYDEICAYDDECAICRGPMARAKKLSCNHLFHLACLRSWLDQGLMDGYSCPTCRRPLFLSSEGHVRSTTTEVEIVQRIAEQLNMGLTQQRVPGNEFPVEQQNTSDAVSRGGGLDASWVQPWSSPGMDNPSSSTTMRSVGLTGVQIMMRQLASVSDNYGHSDSPWNLWPEPMADLSLVPSSSSVSNSSPATGSWHRGTAGSVNNGTMTELLAMLDRVREVLPHIPDQLIMEDLMRTNNINATVNNLLLMQ